MLTTTKAIQDVLEVMQFENWLRFYFARDEEGKVFIRVPEQAQTKIREDYPQFFELVETLNDKPIDYETSQQTVCSFVVRIYDGSKYKRGLIASTLSKERFQEEMQLFYVWLQIHEAQLDQAPLDFATWREIWTEWRNSDEVKEKMAAHQARKRKVATEGVETEQ